MASVNYTIPDNKLAEFKRGFLKCQTVPLDSEGNPKMSENEWIKEWGRLQFVKAYQTGIRQIAREELILEEDVIE